MCRQRAGCNPGTAKADGQRAWWKLPRGMCRQRAGCNPGTAKAGTARPEGLVAAAARKQCSSWRWKLPRGSWRVLSVLSVWSLANGRLECPNKRGLCAGKGQAATLERWRPGAWWKLPWGMCRQRAGCNPGTAKADGQRAWWKLPRGMCRQRAGCNPGTAKAAGKGRPEGLVAAAARKQCSSWRWKLPRGSWRVLRVLSVWSLANGRLECPNKRGLCAGKGQAAMLERWRPRAWWKLPRGMCRKRAGCKPGTAKADGQRAWWKLPRGSWRVLRVLSVWSLANGRLECPNKRGLCAGKGQAATLEQQRLTARGLGGSCREGCAGKGQAATLEQQRLPARGLGGSCREEAVQQLEVEAAARELEGFKGFKRLKPGKRQAWMP